MSVDTIQFVDSIASSPTVRLDVNDGTTWSCTAFDPGLPRLRRAMSQNAMRDGGNVSSSTYDMRTLKLTLALVHTSEDNAATELQKLARELDRTDNFIRYQPTGATKPVFFVTKRSDVAQLEQFTGGAKAFKKPTIELLAEPFALGLRETLGPFTVNNDPAAGSNGLFFDVTGVIGDIETPVIFTNTTRAILTGVLARRSTGTPSNLVFFKQAENAGLGTDTTNPGGGPDTAMSGTGVNNFVRTSFATATMATRVTWLLDADLANDAQRQAIRGRYRLVVLVRRSDNTSDISLLAPAPGAGLTVATAKQTGRQYVDLGMVNMGLWFPDVAGYSSNVIPTFAPSIALQAARTSGAGTLDWDAIVLVPADEQVLTWSLVHDAALDMIIDGARLSVYAYENGADIFAGTATVQLGYPGSVSGGFPAVRPNVTNRFFLMEASASASDKTESNAISADYWPRYLFVRPSAT